jgi:hypothetical protein
MGILLNTKTITTFYGRHGWSVIATLFAALFSFSLLGFYPCIGSNACSSWLSEENVSLWDALFFSLQMLILNYGSIHGDAPWQIQFARF